MAEMKLIYSGKHIQAYAQIYNTKSIFITFNNAGEIYTTNGKFWGDKYFNKMQISAIGIVAKKPNFFPEIEMKEIAQIIKKYTKKRRVISYGSSMGGYGAIRYSKLLHTDIALAFSSPWSMNPAEIAPHLYHVPEYTYDPELENGKGVREEDLHGKIFIFFDPYEYPDRAHINHYRDFKNVYLVIMPFTWHGSLLQFFSNKSINNVIQAAMHYNTATQQHFRFLVRSSRKNNNYYNNIKLKYLANRLETSKLGSSYEIDRITKNLDTQEGHLIQAICHYLKGDEALAITLIQQEISQQLNQIHITDLERIYRICINRHFTSGANLIAQAMGWPMTQTEKSPSKDQIIFESDDIVLHYHKGSSNFTLITFIGIGNEHLATASYLGKPVAEADDITTFGFTTKKRNWYTSKNMSRAIEVYNQFVNKHSKKICIGLSAGGYAAIKYSKLLSPDVALSLAPQLSIDDQEWEVIDEWKPLCTPEMRGMGIKRNDIYGKHIIVYDSKHTLDAKTAATLKSFKSDNVELIEMFYAGHIIYENIKGIEEFRQILACLNGPIHNLGKLLNNIRRKNYVNIYNKIMEAYTKHPFLVYKLLTSQKLLTIKHYQRIIYDELKFVHLLAILTQRGYYKEARDLFWRLVGFYINEDFRPSSNASYFYRNPAPILIDHRGRFLGYSPKEKKFGSCNIVYMENSCIPVKAYSYDNRIIPIVEIIGQIFLIAFQNNQFTLCKLEDYNEYKDDILYFERKGTNVAMKERNIYISIVGDNLTNLNTQWTDTETFTLFYPYYEDVSVPTTPIAR